jgi:streptomycin 6-kinase
MSESITIPEHIATACRGRPERMSWLNRLPEAITDLQRRWSLELGAPFDKGMCSWVAPARRRDGTSAVLKLGMPHMEAEQEVAGLRFWGGEPTVRLIDADEALNAMLLERCVPGHSMRGLAEPEQDVVIADLLRRLWRRPVAPHPFRPLSAMTRHWIDASLRDADRWPDAGLTREGLRLMEELARAAPDDVLLATDLHAGNVLAAQRQPWLVIDPKPFVGDRAYDATQHLFNCAARLTADPLGTVRQVAELLGVDHERVRLWTFARLAAEPRDDWTGQGPKTLATARALAP